MMNEEGLIVIKMKEPVIEQVICAECGMIIEFVSQTEIHLAWHKPIK